MQYKISSCGWKNIDRQKKQVPEKFLDHQTSYNPSKKMRLDAYINTCNHQSIFINCALKVKHWTLKIVVNGEMSYYTICN